MGLERLFDPRGIAVIGASPDPSRPGAQTLAALKEHGFRGGIYPVNPKYPQVAGYRCYESVAAIEAECDVAVIALPAAQVPATVAQCAQRGISHAVVLGGGFRETGEEGAALERAMVAAAREGGVRLIGPNCLGLVNVPARAYAAWGSLTRPPRVEAGPVSAVLQSASLGTSLVMQCAAEGIGFRLLVTSGNEADLTAPEILDFYVSDPETRVVLAYLEGVNDGRAFMRIARNALRAGKPLVVLKAGNTVQGRRAAESHTANLAGDYDSYRAAFRQCGVIEVTDIHEAVDVAKCLLSRRIPNGRRVVVIGGSGGAAAMFSDRADELGLPLAQLTPQTLADLEASLPRLASLKNPIDYTAGYPREQPGLDFHRAFAALANDPGVDQVAVMFAAAGRQQLDYGADVLARVAAGTDKSIVAFSGLRPELAGDAFRKFDAAGIPVLASPKRVAYAMAKLAEYGAAHARTQAKPQHDDEGRRDTKVELADFLTAVQPDGGGMVDEHRSKLLLEHAGIPVTRERVLPLEPGAADCADLPYPVALKILSRDIAHKSDVGGVRLGLANARELVRAASEVVGSVRQSAPAALLEGLLACEMIDDGVETIAGVVHDAAFGPVVAFGLGGIHTEILRDMSYRVAPFDIDEAHAMIAELRARALFAGVRGSPPLDVDALAATLVRISELAWALRERLTQLDINPLLVRPRGRGVIAADALLVLRAAGRGQDQPS
jgi:acetate---CoA ligase (ADP-forming)